ncbi:Uma2 family endonuclease [Microcoleus sp. FACHB-672]|uniref:Uma2 family endonuclease n=1 Tax=Microcoleus sp. FACHB-672 TaxID=2692825 RepID=UPI001682A6DA|nr:Uma2 family endonuclease [Microcoleus sp. FACHB-672]MBD2042340.1 Uma2 family endonuclease [Microcoleus sp. FACHB-672]
MLKYNPLDCLPSSEDLPDSDDTPVDNELQDLIPGLLKAILALLWANRWDWFFGVDMGIYYEPNELAIVPDGFLSIGVERFFHEDLRLSYLLWEENRVPTLVLEVVSHKRRGEYSKKKEFYAEMEVPYYVVYNPRRRKKPPLEVYFLVDGQYILQQGNPVWLPEIGLGIGAERGTYQGITREWLYWYDQQETRFLTPEERIVQAEQRAERLAAQLRALGIDPDAGDS